MNLKSIANTWLVQEENGSRVARPRNPYADKECYPCNQNSDRPYSCICEKFEKADYEIQNLPPLFTSLPIGEYKAEELGEPVWQFHDGENWVNSYPNPRGTSLTFAAYKAKMLAGPISTDTRLFLSSPTNTPETHQ
jgi:hypothetical protein